MAARDIGNVSRLDQARKYIHEFADRRPGDSLGLVSLGSDAALLVPPTTDHRVFLERLDSLTIGKWATVPRSAWDLRSPRPISCSAMTSAKASCSLLTARIIRRDKPEYRSRYFSGKRNHAVIAGIGTKGEVPIEYTDPATGKLYSGFLESEYNEAALKEIALRGKVFTFPPGIKTVLRRYSKNWDSRFPQPDLPGRVRSKNPWTIPLSSPLFSLSPFHGSSGV